VGHVVRKRVAVEEQEQASSNNEENGKRSKNGKSTHQFPHFNNIHLTVIQESNFVFVHTI
jgi:hypothetical protein